jgi:hypothetical protein
MRDVLLGEIDQELLGCEGAPTGKDLEDERLQLLRRVRDDLIRRELSADLLWFVADRGRRRSRTPSFELAPELVHSGR